MSMSMLRSNLRLKHSFLGSYRGRQTDTLSKVGGTQTTSSHLHQTLNVIVTRYRSSGPHTGAADDLRRVISCALRQIGKSTFKSVLVQ